MGTDEALIAATEEPSEHITPVLQKPCRVGELAFKRNVAHGVPLSTNGAREHDGSSRSVEPARLLKHPLEALRRDMGGHCQP